MSTYRCIGCGAVEERNKKSSCSFCGFLMYEEPYDRAMLLKSEITAFFNCLTTTNINAQHFDYYREEKGSNNTTNVINKRQDDKRFPIFNEIQKYICSSSKTEVFHQRCTDTIHALKSHNLSPYTRTYKVSYSPLIDDINEVDNKLKKFSELLGIDVKIPKAEMPLTFANYSETPIVELVSNFEDIFSLSQSLVDKIVLFIKQNNLYGTAYQTQYSPNKDITIEKSLETLNHVVSKKYVVDIFDDGSAELEEMLKVFWSIIKLLSNTPFLEKRYEYFKEKDETFSFDEWFLKLEKLLSQRTENIVSQFHLNDVLEEKTEDELFDILYDEGVLGGNKNTLIRVGKNERKLNELIGLSSIKDSIKKLKAYTLANKNNELNLHMCFYGNPGTGKTEVARIIAGILHENKILPTSNVVEVSRAELVSQYLGETAIKTEEVIEQAMGGVLFIDEAYSLIPKDAPYDYGHEAVATLIKAMEDYRGKFCVILAGYKNEMQSMLSSNPGFKSRIQFELDFPNYSRSEMCEILELMLKKCGYLMSDEAKSMLLDILDVKRKEPNFANAREIRNILDQVIMCQNLRVIDLEDKNIVRADVKRFISDNHIALPLNEGDKTAIMTAEEELESLIGLSAVKRMVKKIRAYAKRNADDSSFNIHMCFNGNPGTGKTEVARIISRILYEAKVLPEAKLVETDAHGLIGKFVGATAPKTEEKINSALGGVLFIDEAYALVADNSKTSYGDEAISVLLKNMEDHRGRFCVVLAGYHDEMQEMIASNPGLKSRIQFSLDFPDYSRDELKEIAVRFASKKKFVITEDALEKILDITDYFRQGPNFANARTVRNILDQVIMNQALRTEDIPNDFRIILSDVEDYMNDENIDLSQGSNKRKIGF